jgi:hypothetical protein
LLFVNSVFDVEPGVVNQRGFFERSLVGREGRSNTHTHTPTHPHTHTHTRTRAHSNRGRVLAERAGSGVWRGGKN